MRDTDQLVIKAVENHYEKEDSPYYLAELGKYFREENIEIPEGVRFKDYLRSRFHGRLVIVQDDHIQARIAVATIDNAARVRQQLSGQPSPMPSDSGLDHMRLPFSLIAAFCKIPLPNTQVYFRITKPFRYDTFMQAPDDDNYVAIDDRFRPSQLAGRSVHGISDSDKELVYRYIEEWAEAKSVDLRQLYYDRAVLPGVARAQSTTRRNALQRLIDAQDPDLKGRIKIPGDIASVLMDVT